MPYFIGNKGRFWLPLKPVATPINLGQLNSTRIRVRINLARQTSVGSSRVRAQYHDPTFELSDVATRARAGVHRMATPLGILFYFKNKILK